MYNLSIFYLRYSLLPFTFLWDFNSPKQPTAQELEEKKNRLIEEQYKPGGRGAVEAEKNFYRKAKTGR
ncbi:MAG: hypothetical protein Hyperionvirus2_184 [Hyperionvirus sp.]|uniref:Uncharacterized protein n=1 Tax=Hyperionvirus sp. TaxID=2487770 RepID=A0A3G5A6D5_9VIRU|nr:MAG: hypothetical protein Hyperionvirus2_184 [Hyperionvirus sp.]